MLRRKVGYVRYWGVEVGWSHCGDQDQSICLDDLEEGGLFLYAISI
jgi:hypothetical protein